jgi:hypothetical protein
MSDKHFTFNFNAPVGQSIANVEQMDVHLDKDGDIQVMNAESIGSPTAKTETPQQIEQQAPTSIPEADIFKYIHYDIDDDKERVRVHKAICHIVKLPKMQQVIDALKELMDNKRIMRTIKQDAMLAELRRLGLPDGSTTGFSDNNFFSAYKHIVG